MKVFLCETIHEDAVRFLAERGTIVSSIEQASDADAVISRALTVGASEMDRMPALKVIAIHGTGTDTVDLEEAKKRGIRVVYAPHLNANAVAELNVALLLTAVRKIRAAQLLIDSRPAEKTDTEMLALAQGMLRGQELRKKTAGLLGFGAIGSRTAEILHAGFCMRCFVWSPSMTAERAAAKGCAAASSPEQVLSEADAVILALPLTAQTRHMIDAEHIALMKEGAVLINAARGGLVDEEALYAALRSGKLYGAACDVMADDFPHRDHPLLSLPNFLSLPHVGANTEEALYEVGMACARQIADVLEGRKPQYPVV